MSNHYFIEPAENLLSLLNTSLNDIPEERRKTLYNQWLHSIIDLYNNKAEFILLGNVNTRNKSTNIFKYEFDKNYENMKIGFQKIKNKDMSDSELFITVYSLNQTEIIDESNKKLNIVRLITFLFQYLHTFEDKSINNNLWNYSLKSITHSYKSTIIGLFTLICQYTMTSAMIYYIYNNFQASDDIAIILITTISTIISCLYSYDTLQSFINSVPLYMFMLKVYDDYPEITLDTYKRNLIYYKNRGISMSKNIILYNLICDFLSNFILPLIIPLINIFIILNSENIVESILNSVAIFFIIQIDEELYDRTDYEKDQMSIDFSRWILSNIYCRYFEEYKPYFVKECTEWQQSSMKLSKRYKNNKIDPNSQ